MADDALRDAVMRRLDLLDQAAGYADAATLVPLARTEINRLAGGWRLLLEVHQPDADGRCAACPSRWRGRRWPCQVWRMAHEHLIGEGVPHRQRTRPLRNPFSRLPRPGEITEELPAVRDTPRRRSREH